MARPQISDYEKKEAVQKLEPYLKSGLSLRKACFQAGIARSTVYYLMEKDKWFLDQITIFQQYLSVLLTTAVSNQLFFIAKKQNRGMDLSKHELKFLQWYAVTSNSTIDEFGRKQNFTPYDPVEEFQKLDRLIEEMGFPEPKARFTSNPR